MHNEMNYNYQDANTSNYYAQNHYAENHYADNNYAQGNYSDHNYAQSNYSDHNYAQGNYSDHNYADGQYYDGYDTDDEPYYNPNIEILLKAERERLEAEARGEEAPEISEIRDLGIVKGKPVNEWLEEAAQTPDPELLWREFLVQGEVTCLFADTNVGKSVLAVQIARDIAATGKRVVYFDFEMSAKQMQGRYSDEATGVRYRFPDKFIRCEIIPDSDNGINLEQEVLPSIKHYALTVNCDVLIIDNLTWLTSTAEHGEAAAFLMKELIKIKKEHNLTILVLAHTPKRQSGTPITPNDLAGSKQLMNFFDAAFSIGKSSKDGSLRYIKQIKMRSSAEVYGKDNVMVCELMKENGFLQFSEVGFSSEWEHLQEPKSNEKAQRTRDVIALSTSGKSIREIAKELNISRGSVFHILKKHRQEGDDVA